MRGLLVTLFMSVLVLGFVYISINNNGPKTSPDPIQPLEIKLPQSSASTNNQSGSQPSFFCDKDRFVIPNCNSYKETEAMGFDDIEWIRYTDSGFGISFDFPKGVFALKKVGTSDGGGKEGYGYAFGSGMVVKSFIHFWHDPKIIDEYFEWFNDPVIYHKNHISEGFWGEGEVIDVNIGGYPGKMMIDNRENQVPGDTYIVPFYQKNGFIDHLVVIWLDKLDYEGYLKENMMEEDKEYILRYKSFNSKIAERILKSISFK